jgi:hypothetical protein
MDGISVLAAKDVNSKKLGKIYATINDNRYLLLFAKNIKVDLEKKKDEVPILGQLQTGHKASGLKYTGTMTIYDCTPLFKKQFLQFQDEGVDVYFDMQISSEDPTSDSGAEEIILTGVNLDKLTLTSLDADGTWKESDCDFTFEKFQMPEPYSELDGVSQ